MKKSYLLIFLLILGCGASETTDLESTNKSLNVVGAEG